MDALGLAQSGLSFVMQLGHGGLLTSSDSNMQVPPVKLWPAKEGSGTWIRVHRAELKSRSLWKAAKVTAGTKMLYSKLGETYKWLKAVRDRAARKEMQMARGMSLW